MRTLHVHPVPPQHVLQAEAAATSAAGLPKHHLGSSSRAFSTTDLTNNKCRAWRLTVVQRPPKAAPITIERYCPERRPWSSPSGLWHPYFTSSTALPPRGDGNYHRVCAAIQTAVRALRCQRRVPRSHPSPEAAHQAENATMQAIFRAWMVAPRARW